MNNSNFQFVFDVALPVALAMSAAVGSYLLTGGEEEFPVKEDEITVNCFDLTKFFCFVNLSNSMVES
jgi:hypothetical protein